MPFRLRYQAHDLELPVGAFSIGRSAECQLSLDDPLVSRKHAVLHVTRDGVVVEDLGSRNGVLHNGVRMEGGRRDVASGDKIQIGSQEMTLFKYDEAAPKPGRSLEEMRRATQTLGAFSVGDLVVEPTVSTDPPLHGEPSKVMTSFRLLGGVAEKALAMGRAEEAERIMQALLQDVLKQARDGKSIDPEVAESSARYAARLAGATTKGSWAEYCFELYTLSKRMMPAPIVDELYTVIRKVKAIEMSRIRAYVAELKSQASTYGPTDRFLLQRIEGLERLGALK